MAAHKKPHGLPSREAVLEFINDSPTPVGRREIARAFNIKGADRIPLKAMLKDLAAEGAIDLGRGRRAAAPGSLPEITVVAITGIDEDGHASARPLSWREEGEPPAISIPPSTRAPSVGAGDRALVKLERIDQGKYRGRIMRKLDSRGERVVGQLKREGKGFRILPADRRARGDYVVEPGETADAKPGELVIADVLPRGRMGLRHARVVEVLGDAGAPRAVSLIAIAEHEIPSVFPEACIGQAEAAKPVTLGKRTDLRKIPLVTIDGSDARDFDDAVHAVADEDPKNPGGFRILVAIADVAHYVRPGDTLDIEAHRRGNSVYFPDRVVPMLPEALSNGLCSLRPNEDRACLAVEMVINARGQKVRHKFMRGLMRSEARLTYEQVQAAADGAPDTDIVPDGVIEPLYGAFRLLLSAREERGALDLDLPERKVVLGDDGKVASIEPRQRLDSHRLIEEFMVLANVAAAETLEAKRRPCMYRVHETPDPEKIDALKEYLEGLELAFGTSGVIRPKSFNELLAKVRGGPHETIVNELVLRSQSQAVYSPDNLGHFGLGLRRYAHFTSPIRRYSDLLVHRALIDAHGFGKDGLGEIDLQDFNETAEHISMTERRAAAAERSAISRYVAAYLTDQVGNTFEARVSGVGSAGLFVALAGIGADGLLPMKRLPGDFYDLDDHRHSLSGRATGLTFKIGDPVTVRLVDADPLTGGVLLDYISGGTEGQPGGQRRGRRAGGYRKHRGRHKHGQSGSARGRPKKSR
ncbi:ribonuclease R [Nisaea acidiphila]|uniref:Ribonuclease R n=1 Tax=Nisaea acidiphila TaxID=1862145 RepID=A0A9J7AXF0_9PROT|nr:ribonuclease R [Nisaea acidiphila]UUX50924.1 ribonuclease R [Nisaea acidiphila]